mmetsp:Transcript_2534/g.5836  ORF Transcript_2534/g.5836 Transcript_2534/m.5836 type:complete len:305 (-) Transcript_2534:320-1234(-)
MLAGSGAMVSSMTTVSITRRPLRWSRTRAARRNVLSSVSLSVFSALRAAGTSCDQNVFLPGSGTASLTRKMKSAAKITHRMLSTVSVNDTAPRLKKRHGGSWRASSGELNAVPNTATAQHRPVFTAGGSSDALMATPTSELVLLPSTLSATPKPDTSAITKPVMRPSGLPRDSISAVGSCRYTPKPATNTPTTKPTSTHMTSESSSLRTPSHSSERSRVTTPSVMPSMGPMMGDTSMLATTTTALLVNRPTAASVAATRHSTTKSKLSCACARTWSTSVSTMMRERIVCRNAMSSSLTALTSGG